MGSDASSTLRRPMTTLIGFEEHSLWNGLWANMDKMAGVLHPDGYLFNAY